MNYSDKSSFLHTPDCRCTDYMDGKITHPRESKPSRKYLQAEVKTYPKRFTKDLYAGNKTSATASLSDSRNSVSGTVH